MWGKIVACIDHEFTQARGRLKKIVSAFVIHPYHGGLTTVNQLKTKEGGNRDPQSRLTIYQLTRTMVGEENYKITPAICTRVAIMVRRSTVGSRRYLTDLQRQVYSKFPHGNFWDEVDKVLDSIKSMPEEKRFEYVVPARFDDGRSPHFLSSFLRAILSRDRRTFGVAAGAVATVPSDDTTGGDESLIQQRIEDLIEAPGDATVFGGPQNVSNT